MNVDRDERRRQALKEELSRVRQYATATRVDHDESARLTHIHVDGLASVLHDHVGSALKGEVGTALAAQDWVSDARTVATWLLRTGAVDIDAVMDTGKPKSSVNGLRGGVVRLRQFLGLESAEAPTHTSRATSVAAVTEHQLVDSLRVKLTDASYFAVDDEEVKEHAADLARLLISNWFAALEESVETQPDEAVKLEYRAFPPTASPGIVTEGCEGFALPAELAISKVFEYQQTLARMGESVALSPIVSLYRSKKGPWYAFHSKRPEVLDALLLQEEPARPRLKDAIERATEAFSPIAIGRAMQLQGSLVWNTGLSHERSYLAANAVRKRFKESTEHGSATIWIEKYQLVSPELTRNVAHAVLVDLEALQPHSVFPWFKSSGPVNRAATLIFEGLEEKALLGDAYMLALPVTAVLLAEEDSFDTSNAPLESTYPGVELTELDQVLFNTTVAIVSSAITEANGQSDQEALGKKLRGMMELGHEPSAFALLSSPV